MSKRVAILSGGGDVPGLNMCLKSLVYRVIDLGYEPIGVRKGWEGLLRYSPEDPSTYSQHFIELTKAMVRPIDRSPGSFLHSSRFDPRRTPRGLVPEFLRESGVEEQDLSGRLMEVIDHLGYKALIVIGDDDTLDYAAYLSGLGVPVIGIPKTINNNIHGTDYTLGFSTCLARGVAFIHELRSLAGSREKILVVETSPARSGYSTLMMGFLGGADRVVIPEVPYDPQKLAHLGLQDRRQTPAHYAVLAVSGAARLESGVAEAFTGVLPGPGDRDPLAARSGLAGGGSLAAELLAHITGEVVLHQSLSYLLRTGPPDGQDLLGAVNFAFTAARLLAEERFGRLAAFRQDEMWTDVDLSLAGEGVKYVDVESWYDPDTYQPKLTVIWSLEADQTTQVRALA